MKGKKLNTKTSIADQETISSETLTPLNHIISQENIIFTNDDDDVAENNNVMHFLSINNFKSTHVKIIFKLFNNIRIIV